MPLTRRPPPFRSTPIVSPGPSFATPLTLAPLSRWDAVARGVAWPVRRTQATFVSGDASVTVPALGVPADALTRLHGWRASDAAASLPALARRLAPTGPGAHAGRADPRAGTVDLGARRPVTDRRHRHRRPA